MPGGEGGEAGGVGEVELERGEGDVAVGEGELVDCIVVMRRFAENDLFDVPGHDAMVIQEATEGAVAGMFCAGELGPVGGRNFIHGFTASIALFGETT